MLGGISVRGDTGRLKTRGSCGHGAQRAAPLHDRDCGETL